MRNPAGCACCWAVARLRRQNVIHDIKTSILPVI
jgi:hypothetical protein